MDRENLGLLVVTVRIARSVEGILPVSTYLVFVMVGWMAVVVSFQKCRHLSSNELKL